MPFNGMEEFEAVRNADESRDVVELGLGQRLKSSFEHSSRIYSNTSNLLRPRSLFFCVGGRNNEFCFSLFIR